ncbi:MAG TPA: ArsA-related P-loop ATPase [Solirubrobacteraceae bacterium]|nr:ArsA-related P-loop ATPase [Solirubrobacteraceae bacterium]
MVARHTPLTERLDGVQVCVCVGPGGVGKTTVSAAIGLGLAARGEKVVVVSIDPAKRLASALGLDKLPGEPHRIDSEEFRGELWAMVLDSKRTFDGLVDKLAPDQSTRQEVLSNRIYRELSSAVAGSQEFTAMAKLYELHREGGWDTIVLDTPPSRNALDFLDAPERLTRFLDGRALRLLSAPGGLARGVLGRGAAVVFALLSRLTGVDVVGELSGFFRSLSTLTDGFRDRAHGVQRLLRDERTRFLIVTSPEQEPVREAVFLAEQLEREGMHLGGLIVNLVHDIGLDGRGVAEVAAMLAPELGEALAARVAANLGDFDVLARRDAKSVQALARELGEADPLLVRHLDGDPQDLSGIAQVTELLFR